MRIDGINNVNNIYKNSKVKKAYETQGVSTSKDTLNISEFAKELQVAKQAVTNEPEIRTDKVNEIKQQMEAGTYNITASQVADKLLKKYLG